MKKGTAVEWLIDELRKVIVENGRLDAISISELKMKAKAMEKAQISGAYTTGVEEDVYSNPLRTGEMYYNDTYL
jgi:hypothetical protein